jgi:very-short-patch-repair endonuclease
VARWEDVVEAVVIIDSLLSQRVTSRELLREYAHARAGDRGWLALSRAIDLADPGAESPQESRTRVRLVLAGIPKPRTQHVITRAGAFLARVDLAWPEWKVAVEYDGRWHDSPGRFDRDRARLNLVLGDGWIVLHLTAQRMREDFDGFVAELRAALRSRSMSHSARSGAARHRTV